MRLPCITAVLLSLSAYGNSVGAQDLRPGQWKAHASFGKNMYTSNLVANASRTYPKQEHTFGKPSSGFVVQIVAPRDGSQVTVWSISNKLIHRSSQSYTLARAGQTYTIFPTLFFDYDQMLRVRQAFPETVRFAVSIDGAAPLVQNLHLSVRPITECVIGWEAGEQNWVDNSSMFGAYVNEDHPLVDKLLSKATDAEGNPMEFIGMQGSEDEAIAQIESVWNLLKRQGFRYSDISETSRDPAAGVEYTQHVRLLGDAFRNRQANCVDGTVLLASIFAKIGLAPTLIPVPGHIYLGVDVNQEKKMIAIETTMLSSSTFQEAMEAGQENLREAIREIKKGNKEYQMLRLSDIRAMGIMPLRDVEGERIDISEVIAAAPGLTAYANNGTVQLRITNATDSDIQVTQSGGPAMKLGSGESVTHTSRPGETWRADVAGRTFAAATPQVPIAEWMISPNGAAFQVNLNQLQQFASTNDLQQSLSSQIGELAQKDRKPAAPPPAALVKMEPGWGVVTGHAVRVFDNKGRRLGKLKPGEHFEILDEDDGEYLTEFEGRKGWIDASQTSTTDEVFRRYNQAVKRDPTAENYYNRAQLLWLNGNPRLFPLALEDFNQAIRLDKGFWLPFWQRAHLLCEMDEIDRAIDDFNAAIDLDPDETPPTSEANHAIADAYSYRGDKESAKHYRNQALKAERRGD